jgi:hypothetical protein
MISRESLQLFLELLLENGRAIPINHPQLVETALKFEKALKEINAELSKPEGLVNNANGSDSFS